MHFPRLVIAGTQSGAGKTTVSLALMAALSRRGCTVQPFKVGPDYIDPSFHRLASGNVSHNLDAWLMPPDALRSLFCRHAPAVAHPSPDRLPGLSLVEGVMGLFDGVGHGAWAGTAHVASLLQAPVVLVMSAKGLALSAAALVTGYASFCPPCEDGRGRAQALDGLRVAGVALNHVSGSRHYATLRRCIEDHTPLACLGYLPKDGAPALPERHLGLVPPEEYGAADALLASLADMADEHLDIAALLRLAADAPLLAMPDPPLEQANAPDPAPLKERGVVRAPTTHGVARRPGAFSVSPAAPGPHPAWHEPSLRIGVPKDAAFSFYYQDNLDLLREHGAEAVFFSPMADASLPPDLDGLYMGGGFPEMFAHVLSANTLLRRELAAALEEGLPAHAECGAMLYLCSSLDTTRHEGTGAHRPEAGVFPMVNFFSRTAELTGRLGPFGYVTVTLLRDCPLGAKGTSFPAHEFHYARLREPVDDPVFHMEKPDGRSWTGGLYRKNAVAGFPHLHFRGCPGVARSFLETCRAYRQMRLCVHVR